MPAHLYSSPAYMLAQLVLRRGAQVAPSEVINNSHYKIRKLNTEQKAICSVIPNTKARNGFFPSTTNNILSRVFSYIYDISWN